MEIQLSWKAINRSLHAGYSVLRTVLCYLGTAFGLGMCIMHLKITLPIFGSTLYILLRPPIGFPRWQQIRATELLPISCTEAFIDRSSIFRYKFMQPSEESVGRDIGSEYTLCTLSSPWYNMVLQKSYILVQVREYSVRKCRIRSAGSTCFFQGYLAYKEAEREKKKEGGFSRPRQPWSK